jgi:hypothetical protein
MERLKVALTEGGEEMRCRRLVLGLLAALAIASAGLAAAAQHSATAAAPAALGSCKGPGGPPDPGPVG